MRALPASQRALVLKSIEEQLTFEPLSEIRNRKPMRANMLAEWELRIGNIRVYYDVVPLESSGSDEPGIVRILAVGRKEGNRLFIGGKEFNL
jgi:mRNA-degrading endonuclease RelE of RelBE toxin-antitoxin system